MTRKRLDIRVDELVNRICKAHQLDPTTGVKGGERETAYGMLGAMINREFDRIIAYTNPPAGWEQRAGVVYRPATEDAGSDEPEPMETHGVLVARV